jgi:sugar phosphate isomerase/epimerase
LILGYNTNGLSGVDAVAAIEALAEIGYAGVALSVDHGLLNPFGPALAAELEQAADALERHQFRAVIETGARFLLDAEVKHEPTLVTADPAGRARRVDFLCRAIDMAAAVGADCVSFWSGRVRDGAGDRAAMDRLVDGLASVLEHAERRGAVIGFEPEPDMFIDTLARYGDLLDELSARQIDAARLQLTIDVGHLHCLGELPIADHICQWGQRLVNVHIEDMRHGVHEHLMFGEGEIDFPPVIAALAEIGYDGPVNVELSRHAHEGLAAARRARDFLAPLLDCLAADA